MGFESKERKGFTDSFSDSSLGLARSACWNWSWDTVTIVYRVRRGKLWNPQEMCTEWKARLQKVFCCIERDETGDLDVEERREW